MSRSIEYTNMMQRIQEIRDETRSRRFMAIANLYEINGWRDIRFEKNNEEFEEEEDFDYENDTETEDEDDE